jgi:hypothetical protein
MIYYIDIDDTICRLARPMEYSSAYPIPLAIKKINALYSAGHQVNFWTARGTVTGKDWRALTEEQLAAWGVNYHNLYFGKPHYDWFIDDKNINSNDWLNGRD